MLQILLGSIHENISTYRDGGLNTDDLEKVLADIEKAGMLPPATDWLIKNHPEEMIWSEVNDYHLWEPENE